MAQVSYGTLLDFEAAFWMPDLQSRPLNMPRGEIVDFSGGLLSDPGVVNFEANSNRFRFNQGIQTRYPGTAVLPYVLKNQGSIAASSFEGHWKLDESSGDALDATGNGHTLTETGGTIASATGKVGNGRDFEEGDTEYFEGADAAWNSITGSMTISAWVKIETKDSDMSIVSKWEATGDQRSYKLIYSTGDDRFLFQVTAAGVTQVNVLANTFGSPSLDTWYFVAARHTAGATIEISVNGGAWDSTAHTTSIFDGTAPFRLGANNISGGDAQYWDGVIDEVSLQTSAATDAQITFRYNGGTGRTYEQLTAADADISSYNTNGVRAHGIVSTAGGTRYLVGLGTKLYRANTSTGAMEIAGFTIDGGAATSTFGGNATCVAQGIVGGSNAFLIALEGANDILYTTDVTANNIAFTTLKTTTSGDWIAAMRYFPTVGPGAWAIVGTLDGVAGVFSELGSTLAASWDPQQATLEEFANATPTAPVSFTAATSPSTGANDATDGDVAWTDPSNATTSNGAYATSALTSGQTTQWLKMSGFSFSGPASTDQIVGVLVEVERDDDAAPSINDYQIQLRLSGVQVGRTKHLQTLYPSADTYKTFGAFDDCWFAELTGADLTNLEVWYRAIDDFGGGGDGTASVDHVRVSLAYRSVSIARVIKTARRPFAAIQSDLAITPSARWTSIESALASDGVNASIAFGGADNTSDYMILGPFFAPGELSSDLDVRGIQVDIERSMSNAGANTEDLVVQLFFGGALVGFNQATLATEWNFNTTTEYTKSYGRAGYTWGVTGVDGDDMTQLFVAIRVLGDANSAEIDAVTMHVEGLLPGQNTSFDGGDLGGIGSTGSGSVKNGWMVTASPTDPEALTIVVSGDMFRLTFDWDVDQARMTFDFTKPNTGLAYVHHAQPYLGGYIVTGGGTIGVGNQVKVVASGGDVVPFNFPLYHGDEEVRVNSIMVQGLWAIHDVMDADAGDRQWWFMNDQARYYPDTILQSLSENEAGTGKSSISATPIAWSTQPVYGPLNMIYSVFPNSTDTAWARQFLPSDLGSNPIVTNASEVRTMAFDSSGVENTALYIETCHWDYGPPDANKTLNTLRYNDRQASADAGSYGTVQAAISTDGSSFGSSLNTFDSGFERHRLATTGTAFRSLAFRFSLSHTAGSVKSPNALPWVFEADVQMPALRHWNCFVDPTKVQPNLIAFMQAVNDLMDTKTTQTLKVSTVRDGINTATLGAVATIDAFSWSAPWETPTLGEPPDEFKDQKGSKPYLIIGFAERIGTVT